MSTATVTDLLAEERQRAALEAARAAEEAARLAGEAVLAAQARPVRTWRERVRSAVAEYAI